MYLRGAHTLKKTPKNKKNNEAVNATSEFLLSTQQRIGKIKKHTTLAYLLFQLH
jgi:hypothetical protein